MKSFKQACAVAALLPVLFAASAQAQASKPSDVSSKILLRQATAGSDVTIEQFGENMVIVSERGTDRDSPLRRLDLAAKSAETSLCAAQIFAYLSDDPVPDILFAKCPDRKKAMSDLDALTTRAKTVAIGEYPIESRPGFCNNLGNDAQQFKDIECSEALLSLFGNNGYDEDHAYWCANTLRSSSVRIGPEGDDSESRTVSCHGDTRFRLYKRPGSGDPWTKYRDHLLSPNEFEVTWVIVWETYSDSDTKFVIDSESGAWHRNTGWFLDE
jgi:hypothetical protein